MTGPALDRLASEPVADRFLGRPGWLGPGGELIAVAQACGHPRVVVAAPAGSTAELTWATGTGADGTVRWAARPVVATHRRGLVELHARVGPVTPVPDCLPTGSGCTSVAAAVAAAPGDGDRERAVALLREPGDLPLPTTGLRVLWRGSTGRGGTVAVAAVVTVAGARDPAPAGRCPGYAAGSGPPGAPAPDGVRGSLGRDAAAVTAVLRTGWAALAGADGPGAPPDPATARVRLVERTGDGIVGVVAATGSGPEAGYGRDAVVTGPDRDHLRARVALDPYEAGAPRPAGLVPATACTPAQVVDLPPASGSPA